MKDIVKPGLVLLVVTFVAALCLGFVHEITKEPIARQLYQAMNASMSAILPQADTYVEVEYFHPSNYSPIFNVTRGEASGEVVGYIVGASKLGYSGRIDVLVGLDTEGVIQGITILRHTETPGLGANAALPVFTDQFVGGYGAMRTTRSAHPALHEVTIITASTITTDSIVDAVNAALDHFEQNLR